MSSPATSAASRSATFSPALESGATPFGLPDGATTDLFGLAPVRANLSPRQAKELDFLTSGTSGHSGTTSSRSASLQSSLESKLRAKTQILGSTLYRLTWKPWITPSGRSRFRLRASALRTSESGFSGWPTPSASGFEVKDVARMIARRAECKARTSNGNGFGLTLGQAVALWFPALTASGARLNPELSRWLQGLEREWSSCAPTETPSTARRLKRSSKQ